MRKSHMLVITGLLVPFLTMNAYAENEDAPLSSLDEELTLLDEEFEEFKEELFSLENELQENAQPAEAVAEAPPAEPAIEDVAKSEPVVEKTEEVAIEKTEAVEAQPVAVKEEAPAVAAPAVEKAVAVVKEAPAVLSVQGTATVGELGADKPEVVVDLKHAFSGSPIIYTILLGMSVFAVFVWLYALMSLRGAARLPSSVVTNLHNKLNSNNFDEALFICSENNSLFCKMVASGIHARRHGLPVMIEAMKAEGKRSTTQFWQRIGLLNDVAIIAPMLGLLGTVLGMFYAFYDINRSIESISTLFDGLGISVGTTVAGLVVAILALILHSTAKYRLVKALALVENEAQSAASLIDDRTSIYKG